MNRPPALPDDIAESVRRALTEDIGRGDLTAGLVDRQARARGQLITREEAILCGRAWFNEVFHQLDTGVRIDWSAQDGDCLQANQILCSLEGPARALLTGERTAMNFLQTLSGTATQARRYVDAVSGTRAVILDTRKTVPGLRLAQKYAVRCAGAQNHRLGLYDAILIKENHIAAAGSVRAAVEAARRQAPAGTPLEVEVENLDQLREALAAGVERLLLDNFSLKRLREAVAENNGRAQLEASGGITLDNVRAVADTGVDCISIGAITKHVQAVDLSLRFSAN